MTTTQSTWALNAEQMTEMLFSATQELFTSMLGVEVQRATEPEVEAKDPFDGVMSLIGLTGKVIGSGALICSARTACDLSSRFLMSEFQFVDEQVLDAMGELTNMIVGGFKNLLEPEMGRLHMSIPSVIHGINISTRNLKADVSVVLRCTYSNGDIRLKVGLAVCSD